MEKEIYERTFMLEDHYWWFVGQKIWVTKFLDAQRKLPQNPNLRILDAGGGTGGVAKILENYGRVWVIDKSEIAISFCLKRNLNRIIRGSILNLPFKDEAFDLITILGVLYHKDIVSDDIALEEIYRVCKEKGRVFFSEPAYKLLWSSHDILEHSQRRYRLRILRKKIERVGFAIDKISYINSIVFPIIFFYRMGKKIFPPKRNSNLKSDLQEIPRVFNKILILFSIFESFLIKRLVLPFGATIICIASKEDSIDGGGGQS